MRGGFGLTGKVKTFSRKPPKGPGKPTEYDEPKYGIVFSTYGGNAGPRECIATLEVEKEFFATKNIPIIAQFA